MSENNHVLASIIIPAFNEAGSISQCLDSICADNSMDLEIIVVDDASTDKTASLVQTYGDPRVRVISNASTLGAGGCINVGVGAAISPVLLFINADCLAEPDWVYEALQSLSNNLVYAVEGAIHYPTSNTRIWQKIPLNPFYNLSRESELTIPGQDFASGNFATKRQYFERVNGFNSKRYPNGREDTDFGMRLMKLGKIEYNPKMAVSHKMETWTCRNLLENARRYTADVKIFKDHGNFPYSTGRILHPRLLLMLLFPPMIFMYYEVRSTRAFGFIPKFMLYLVVLRFTIWKAAITERIILI